MNIKSNILLFLFALVFVGLSAQDTNTSEVQMMDKKENMESDDKEFKHGLTAKALFMDYQSQQPLGSIDDLGGYHQGFELGYLRNITDRISVGIPLKVGVVNYNNEINDFHKTIISADLIGQYNFLPIGSTVVPYAMVGYGYVYEKIGHPSAVVENNLQGSAGIGAKLRLEDRAYLNWESQYRYSLSDDRHNLHHGLGLLYYLGKRSVKKGKRDLSQLDSDGDGIIDELDLCPQIAGLEFLQGCPDKDGDGIADYLDKCPEIAGLKEMNGCPDTDGDGVSDNKDECPNIVGPIANRGCPANDADKDGIPNELDKCPTVAGPVSNNGCPEIDTDNDGTPDNIDLCPNIKGTKSTLGCPDGDGDGIPDKDDRCPSTRGTPQNNGCPSTTSTTRTTRTTTSSGVIRADSDGDGILDIDDLCPNQRGLATFSGCPDTDGDGIDDSRDNCPRTPGKVDNGGCPRTGGQTTYSQGSTYSSGRVISGGTQIAQRDLEFLEIAMRSIQFESGKAELKIESYRILRQISEILNRYPGYNLSISGHTDNVGGSSNNQILSENRAKACYLFLSNAGIDISRMNYAGFGESQPVSDNKTVSGRTLNRRVEFTLIPR